MWRAIFCHLPEPSVRTQSHSGNSQLVPCTTQNSPCRVSRLEISIRWPCWGCQPLPGSQAPHFLLCHPDCPRKTPNWGAETPNSRRREVSGANSVWGRTSWVSFPPGETQPCGELVLSLPGQTQFPGKVLPQCTEKGRLLGHTGVQCSQKSLGPLGWVQTDRKQAWGLGPLGD